MYTGAHSREHVLQRDVPQREREAESVCGGGGEQVADIGESSIISKYRPLPGTQGAARTGSGGTGGGGRGGRYTAVVSKFVCLEIYRDIYIWKFIEICLEISRSPDILLDILLSLYGVCFVNILYSMCRYTIEIKFWKLYTCLEIVFIVSGIAHALYSVNVLS
jgi:hypothetical protein